jgi:hypothetical protein
MHLVHFPFLFSTLSLLLQISLLLAKQKNVERTWNMLFVSDAEVKSIVYALRLLNRVP